MKKIIIFCAAASVILAVGVVPAIATYIETINVYTVSVGGTISWNHTYNHSADPVTSVSLTIVADDVDGAGAGNDGEQDMVSVKDKDDIWHELGFLNQLSGYTSWGYARGPGNPNQLLTTTVFSINPSWLNGLPVSVKIEGPLWQAEIETSTLTVVPEPATVGILSLGTLSLLRRKK